MQKKIIVTEAMHNRKIEYILSGDLHLSGGIMKKLKRAGGILLNGKAARTNECVKEGDELCLVFPEEKSENIVPEEMKLDILYEDEDILAINKPSGIITHPVGEHLKGTLANGVMFHLKSKSAFHVITRLDKETSGVVLIAKNALSAQKLNDAMKKHEIKKEYVAVTAGCPSEMWGIINAPIKRGEGIKRFVAPDGKKAVTEYFVEKTDEGRSLVRVKPITGRTHQIRVHLNHIGTPIVGDWLYGETNGQRLMLHCRKIEFCHPSTGELLEIQAPCKIKMLKTSENCGMILENTREATLC